MRHREEYNDILADLKNRSWSSFEEALAALLEADARTLEVEQVGYWKIEKKAASITLLDMFVQSQNKHVKGHSLAAKDYPFYFKALDGLRILSTEDACEDPFTSEFKDNYLIPQGITSMLDIGVRYHGSLIGTLCHEHKGPKRPWQHEEENFALGIADLISAAIGNEEQSNWITERKTLVERIRALENELKKKK